MVTNAQLIAQLLQDAGVKYVFGMPGLQILALIEALHQVEIEYVLVSQEMSAGFMADVYGRLTGQLGVCLVPPGPGATNLLTGIGSAYLNRSPVLAITGQMSTATLYRRGRMPVDHQAFYQPITKASYLLQNGSVASTLRKAIRLALEEPPGPIHLDLPEDVSTQQAIIDTGEEAETMPLPLPQVFDPMALHKLEHFLRQAKFPLVALGSTAMRSGAFPAIQRFLEHQHLPFVTTLTAKGIIPETHPLFAGVLGQARHDMVKAFCHSADLILGIGYDPVELSYEEWIPKVPLIHIDAEPVHLDLTVRIFYQIIGNFRASLQKLADLPALPNRWTADRIQAHRERVGKALRPELSSFAPHTLFDILREEFPAEGILTCDVGAHTHILGQQWPVYAPNTFLSSNGWAAMGFGLAAAIAAKLVFPDRPVACVMGDGGFLMSAGEIATLLRLGLTLPIVVLNDAYLSLCRIQQHQHNYAPVGVKLLEKASLSASKYLHIPVVAVHTPEEFRTAFREALFHSSPTILEVFIDPAAYEEVLIGW